MNLRPCVHSCTFNINDGRLNVIVNQRSADLIVAGGWNLTQYAVLAYMFAQVSDLKPGILKFVIADAHIYDRHFAIAEELIKREPFPGPKLIINPDVKNFYDFRVDDFVLENYQTHPQISNIPVAI
jgi:thymidylate synthase